MSENENGPLVSVIMGSRSDLPTMRHAADVLRELGVAHEVRIVSAHRTPELMTEFARSAKDRGVKVIIAGAGGAAHLPGHGGGEHHLAGDRRAGGEQRAERVGFVAFNRADAAWRAGGYGCDRSFGCGECGFVSGADDRGV